mgnify:FL=1
MKKGNKEAIELSKYVSEFLDRYAELYLTDSVHTLKSYRLALALYLEYLEDGKDVHFRNFSKKCFEKPFLEDWIKWLKEVRNASNSTINVRLGSLRRFIKYLSERKPEYLYLYSEAKSVELLKTEKHKIEGLTKDAISAILDAVDTSTKSGKFYFTLIVFLYATGARLDEALSLKTENLHLDDVHPHATIVGKGAKARTVYLLKEAADYLDKYKDIFLKSERADGYFFFSRNGGSKAKLSQTAVQKALHKYAAIAHEACNDVPLDLHAHQFRHARASHWLDEGINIVQISHLLGHESLEVTMRYLDISIEMEAKALLAIQSDEDRTTMPKWINPDGTLKAACGL